jgi:hypothetical protein
MNRRQRERLASRHVSNHAAAARDSARARATRCVGVDVGFGFAVLRRETGEPFRWQGRAHEILERLRALPDGADADAVIAAFLPKA